MDFSPDALTSLQRAVLDALAGGPAFFLSGGAALAAGYLGHRRSLDLDLFVPTAEAVVAVAAALEHAAAGRQWELHPIQQYPGFRRYSVRDAAEATLVDIVHEAAAQIVPVAGKPFVAGVRIDALADLVTNKLCAVLGRGETKDLVDLYFLAEAGHDVLGFLPQARRKDAGLEPATLAWVLQTMPLDPGGLLLLRPVATADLLAFRDRLVARLTQEAWPA